MLKKTIQTIRLSALVSAIVLSLMAVSWAAPPSCTISGQVFQPDLQPFANGSVLFSSNTTQVVGGFTIDPISVVAQTDANGNLSPTPTLPQGLVVSVALCKNGSCGASVPAVIPLNATANFGDILAGISIGPANANMGGARITNVGCPTANKDALVEGCSIGSVNPAAITGTTVSGTTITGSTLNSTGNTSVGGTLTANGVTVTGNTSVGGNLSVTGTTTLSGNLTANGASTLNGIINPKAYGASGSDASYSCSISSGSTTLTCSTPTDFAVGQVVAVRGAGISTPIGPATSVTVTNIGATGTHSVCYKVVAADPAGGMAAPAGGSGAACVANGPAATGFNAGSGLQIAFDISNSNIAYGIYRSIDAGAYQYIGTTHETPYKDYGSYDGSSAFDWPSTPSSQPQTLFATITGGSGNQWTLDTAASTSVTNAFTRHDDTAALQAALDNAAGKLVDIPAGYYHINRYMFTDYSTGARLGYGFTANMLGKLESGSLLVQTSNTTIRGDATGGTHLVHDYLHIGNARGGVFTVTPPGLPPLTLPQGAGNTFRFTTYPFNSAAASSNVITLTNPTDASAFNVGDYVYLAGGAALDGYAPAVINRIVAIDSTSGVLTLADPLPFALPFGPVGIANAIINLSANNAIIHDLNIEHLMLDSASNIISGSAIYRLRLYDIHADVTCSASMQDLVFGLSALSHVSISHSSFRYSHYAQVEYLTDLNMDNNVFIADKPHSAMAVQAAASPARIHDNIWFAGCDNPLVLYADVDNLLFHDNYILSNCTVPHKTVQSQAPLQLKGNDLVGSVGHSAQISHNTIVSGSDPLLQTINNDSMWSQTLVTGNTMTQYRQSFMTGSESINGIGIATGNLRFTNNTVTFVGNGNTGATEFFWNKAQSVTPLELTNNTFLTTGTENLNCITFNDPGSLQNAIINVSNNRCINAAAGITVVNPTNLPNVILQGNVMDNVTTPYSPASLGALSLANATTNVTFGMTNATGLTTSVPLSIKGSTSGTITVAPQAAAGTYNFNLPTTAGVSGQFLTSAGGGAAAMTWGPVKSAVASLPTCNSSSEGIFATATDCNAACGAGGTCTGGGATHCGLYCNGSAWKETGQ